MVSFWHVLILLAVAFIYFIPSLAAGRKPQANSVIVINLFLGWTLIGWVIALAMAVAPAKATSGSRE